MTRRVFTTTGWNQTGDGFPKNLGEIDGVQTISYLTIDKAVAACDAGDVVEPCRPGMQDFSFVDADGLPLKTVVVPLGAGLLTTTPITLQGGWCRLRLDGGGEYKCCCDYPAGIVLTFADLDVVNCTRAFVRAINAGGSTLNITRCLIAGTTDLVFCWQTQFNCTDCVIVNNCKYDYRGTHRPIAGRFLRCATDCGDTFIDASTSADNIVFKDWTPELLAAAGFVAAPKAIDTSRAGYYTDGTAFDAALWQNIDLRLLPTSQYASGATSVQSGQEVYDVAGIKRKVGGALGAYEVLDATPTHYPCESRKGWKVYATRDDETAPKFKYGCMYVRGDLNSTHIELDETSNSFRWSYKTGDTWTGLGTRLRVLRTTLSATNRIFRATFDEEETADSKYCTIQFYDQDETAPEGAVPCKFLWSDGRFFNDADGAPYNYASNRPTSESVVYIDDNIQFVDAASQNVGKIIQEGFVHTDLGGAEGEIILGRDSTAKTCGKLTWSGQTTTSAAALARVVPRAPAELTFKECAITD